MGFAGRLRAPFLGVGASFWLAAAALTGCGRTSFDPEDNPAGGSSSGGRGGSDGRGGATSPVGKGGAPAGAAGLPAGSAGMGGTDECPAADVLGTRGAFDRQAAANGDFLALPWPELGRPLGDLAFFPNPDSATGCSASVSDPNLAPLIAGIDPIEYRAYVSSLAANFLTEGPNNAAVYMKFDAALNPAGLPSAAQTLDATISPVLLVNLANDSARGRLVPVLSRVFTTSRYLPANTLSILPHPGFPLEPSGLYAAVVLRSLGDAAGQALGSPAALERLKQTDECPPQTSPGAEYADAFFVLESVLGISRDDVAMMSVFRAGSPTAQLGGVIAQIDAIADPAALANLSVDSVTLDNANGWYLLSGSFETLIHQYGTPPFLPQIDFTFGGADVTFSPQTPGSFLAAAPPLSAGGGDDTVPRTERIPYKLSIPLTAVGDAAAIGPLPIVVYGPGTGGSLDSPFLDGSAQALAGMGMATFATDPVMHDARAHSENIDPELISTLEFYDSLNGTTTVASLIATVESGDLFFNPLDLQAAKGNSLQAAVDYAWQARLLGSAVIQTNINAIARTIQFDPARRYFLGHSQGAATGPLLESSAGYDGLVLSAPSGHLPSNLLGKTKPAGSLGIAQMLSYIVCEDATEPVDVHHPFLNLLLHWFEEADAVNYAPYLIKEASSPKHVFVTSGTADQYVPRSAHEAVTTAARLHQLSPQLGLPPGQSLLNLLAPNQGYGSTFDLREGNLVAVNQNITGAFRQYHDDVCADDHFVYTCNASARADWHNFFATSASVPTVPAP